MQHKTIYLMPGMAASPKIFELINLPSNIKVEYLSWINPFKNESLFDYAIRMSKMIKSKNPILLGVSLGGVLVQEISRIIKCEKVIIVSSVKTRNELPVHMKMAKHTKIHKFFPLKWIESIEDLVLFVFGDMLKIRINLYKKYLSFRDPEYLAWAINALVNWKCENSIESIIHIHGAKDNIFPIKFLKEPLIQIKGSHAIILTQADWFNENLPKLIFDKY